MPGHAAGKLERLIARGFPNTVAAASEVRIPRLAHYLGFAPAYVAGAALLVAAVGGHDAPPDVLPTLAQVDAAFLIALSVLARGTTSFHGMARRTCFYLVVALAAVLVAMAWNQPTVASFVLAIATLCTLASAWTLLLVFLHAMDEREASR